MLGVAVLALGWLVLVDGLQPGNMADAFGYALSEEHLSSHLQVFWVLDKLEEYHCFLPSPQLLLIHSCIIRMEQKERSQMQEWSLIISRMKHIGICCKSRGFRSG